VKKILNLYKEIGETPLERLNRFRVENKKYKNEKMSYVGRLDPMAEGILLVVIGEENKNRTKYLNLKKEYEFEILFGFETDTFDLLGMVKKIFDKNINLNEKIIKNVIKNFKGKLIQKYPPYSSKTVRGKPLFEFSRDGRINEVEIPEKEIEIYKLNLINLKKISKKRFLRYIQKNIYKIKGDFRQKDILKIWENKLKKIKKTDFFMAKMNIKCSSGTYIRGIANEIGKILGCGAIAFSIKRIKVGKYLIKNSIK